MAADLVVNLLLKNKKFDDNIAKARNETQAFKKSIGFASASVSTFISGFAGMAGVSLAFMDVIEKSMQFEKSLSSLRSLTGVSAKDLEFFKNEAIKMGSASMQTASQVVEAFQLIGSQKPELLKNKEALAEVTQQAIILAEASGMTVPEAAKALTGSLNQMGESASKAGEYINILAAASQAGSADIPYLTKAIEKSGGAASSVGVSYNELVAAIETIAPKVTEASEAGTNLRNIFLILEGSADKKLKPSIVGLSTALENLASKNMDATQMTKMFGRESVTAALAIVSAKDDYNRYVEAITGTNTALEQQKINNDNLAGSVTALSSAWEGFALTLNNSNGVLKSAADAIVSMFNAMTEAMKTAEQKQTDAISSESKKQKEQLNKDILYWQKAGMSKKEAIEKVLETLPRNYETPNLSLLASEEKKLKELESRYDKLKNKNVEVNPFGIVGALNSVIMPSLPDAKIDVNPITQPATMRLKEEIEERKKIVSLLKIQNEAYDNSVKYLHQELEATENIASTNKDRTTRGILKEEDRLDKISEKEKITVPIKIGSEKDLTMQIAKIKEKIEAEANPDIRFDLLKQQNNLQTQLDQIIKNNKRVIDLALNIKPLKSDVLKGTTGKRVIDDIEKYRKELNAFSESNQNSAIKGSVEDIQKRIQEVTLAYNRATTDGLRALYAQQREDLEEHLQNMTDINSQMIDISNEMNSLVKSGVTSAFESIGDIIGSDDSSEAFKNSLMGMMDMLKQFGASLVAAGMAKMAFDKLFTNPYLAIAAGGALIIAATAAKSALGNTKGYANGGIIPGNSVSGDRVLARVNSGEMILNQMQQGNLFNMLNNPSSSGSDTQTPEVVFHIKGNDLIGVLNNTNKKTSRTK